MLERTYRLGLTGKERKRRELGRFLARNPSRSPWFDLFTVTGALSDSNVGSTDVEAVGLHERRKDESRER